MNNYFEKEFELRYFEMNKFQEATPTTILTLLEETAADHCYSIDKGLFTLEEENIGWVLVSGFMKMDRYPKYKEKITIRTWLSEYSTVKGFRENLIYGENGEIIGRAKGLWLYFDIKRRRPARISDVFINKWGFDSEVCLDENISRKIKPIEEANISEEFKINNFDIDSNNHVNNIRYLQWTMNSIPEDIVNNYFLHSIDGRFVSEAKFGETIVSLIEKGDKEGTFIHTIKTKENNRVCAVAKTVWEKRN